MEGPRGQVASLSSASVGVNVGVGIGIGIDPVCTTVTRCVMHGRPTLSELRQHGHDPVEPCLGLRVVLGGHRTAGLTHILRRAALEGRAPCHLDVPSAIAVCRLAMALGHVQRDGLRCAQKLILRVAMSLQRFTGAIRPADVFNGCAIHIELLMPETHVVPFDPDSDSDPDFFPPSCHYLSNLPRVKHFADDIPTRGRHFVHFVNILVLDAMLGDAAIHQ